MIALLRHTDVLQWRTHVLHMAHRQRESVELGQSRINKQTTTMMMTKQNKREITRNANNNGARAIENSYNNKAREVMIVAQSCSS